MREKQAPQGTPQVRKIFIILICMTFTLAFTSCQSTTDIEEESDNKATQAIISKEEPTSTPPPPYTQPPQTAKKETTPTRMEHQKNNKKAFYKKAQAQGIDTLTIDTCWQALCNNNCFQNGALALTELCIADIDSNGQTDMLIRVADAQYPQDYGSGALWFYLNEDTPYTFCDEWCPYRGDCWLFWEDIDNDTYTEIVFCAQGTGVGATGDMYKAIFKYKNHAIEQMRLPSDMAEDDGFAVEVIQNPEQNSYSAYCPYFDEQISFHAENMDGKEPPATPQTVGRNVRGFCDLRIAEYQGKKALQASEYLCGEGAVPHYVATAQFLIVWQKDGTPDVVRWWIDEHKFSYGNLCESRICYDNECYYYASQSDNYFLYRVNADGSEPQCLVKAHCSNICVQDGDVYFVNQNDGYGIYRINADTADLEKLCDFGCDLQVSAEYVYFCAPYDAQYDTLGLAGDGQSALKVGFLYRMNRDGSQRVLIAAGVSEYVLSDGVYQEVRYAGAIYYSELMDEGFTVWKMDLNGQNAEEVCHFDLKYFTKEGFYMRGMIAVMNGYINCIGADKEDNYFIARFCLWNKEMTVLTVPQYTDGCFYQGYFYGICRQEDTLEQTWRIFKKDLDTGRFQCYHCQVNEMRGLYATGNGLFWRQLVSEQEGLRWFQLMEDGAGRELEDRDLVPVTLPARAIQEPAINSISEDDIKRWEAYYSQSVTTGLESTDGYKAYLMNDLEFEAFYRVNEDGKALNPYRISLPQFNSSIAGYRKINQYFQNAYQEALQEKENFFQKVRERDEEEPEMTTSWYQCMNYSSIYIDEQYITVAKYETGYWGGIRVWTAQSPVTFDRTSGEVLSLEDILGMPEQECIIMLTSSAYKYMEGIGRETFYLDRRDFLTNLYDPTHFFVCSDGIGIHYERYDIDCGAGGDYLFVIPYENFAANGG